MNHLESLSKQALIERVRELDKALKEHQRAATLSETLLHISELAYDESLNIDTFYQRVCETLNNVIDTSNFYIARIKKQGTQLSFDFFRDTFGIQFEHAHDFPVRSYGKGLTEMVIDEGKTLLLDHSDIEDFLRRGLVSPRRNCAHSWLGSPLVFNSEKLGAIVVQSYRPDYMFGQDDKNVFHFVSQHVAAAISRYETKKALEFSASTDPLTGLLNRRTFTQRLEAMVQSGKGVNQSCVLFIDLDGFKIVNDTYGHQTGDALLVKAAHIIRSQIREIDDVCRLGGDEFVVLMYRLREPDDALNIANRLLALFSQPIPVHNISIQIGASIGIAFGNDRYEQGGHLLRDADLAMYKAKREGKSRYFVAD